MRTHQLGAVASAMALASLVALGAKADDGKAPARHQPGLSASDVIASWPAKPKEVATQMIGKYGQPDGLTSRLLLWYDEGPWAEIRLYRDEVPHNWPKPHTDLLEQVVKYRPSPDRFDDLASFDGSVIAERTKGTLAARCDKEEMNFLAINLANDVASGKRTVAEARRFYEETAMAFMKGDKRPYTQKLQFDPPRGATGDKDSPAAMASK